MQGTSFAGRSILIVEDEPRIARGILTAFKAFKQAGAVVLAARALADRFAEHAGLSSAVVDLGDGEPVKSSRPKAPQRQASPAVVTLPADAGGSATGVRAAAAQEGGGAERRRQIETGVKSSR